MTPIAALIDSERRHVALWSVKDGLSWSCTHTNNADMFYKHLVVASVSARDSTAK